ncbi:MAG: cellulase family glycosylhydrolase [Bacteroidales bacterium]
MRKNLFILLIPFLFLAGCKSSGKTGDWSRKDTSLNGVTVEGTRFVDSFGRQVIFHGINRVNKDPNMKYLDADSNGTYEQFSISGFNCIRLGIIWDGMEPEPGKYNEAYLDKLEERVNWATRNGIYVMLDMHQDLYSVLFSDGAPKWATLTEGQPHAKGAIWSDSYFMSMAVQKAFDNFWANTPASDSIGIQDHYARMWQHIAKRFAGNKGVIGYDIMNEPFNGSQGLYILPVILQEYAKMYAEETGKVMNEKEVMEVWADEEKRLEALSRMQDAEKYKRVIDVATSLSQEFEKNQLQNFYQRVANQIREVDTTHILFLEHAYFSNTGISSGISPVKMKDGSTDPLVAYAAHGYDLLTDTKQVDAQCKDRVSLIFRRIDETSKQINVPVLVGEWGAMGGNAGATVNAVNDILTLFEQYHFGHTFWAYYDGLLNENVFKKALLRPYPPFISGKLVAWSYEPASGKFTCTWTESPEVKAPTVIYLPMLEWLDKESISLVPEGENAIVEPAAKGPHGFIQVPSSGGSETRTLQFTLGKKNDPSIPISRP